MGKQRKRKRVPLRKPYGLYIALGIVNTLRGALFLGTAAAVLLILFTHYWLGLLAALSILITAISLGSLADTLNDAIKLRHERIEKRQLKKLRAPHLAAWRASLLDTDLQPNGAELVPVDEAELLASEAYQELGEYELKRINELGLGVYRDPREHGTRWIGRVNPLDPNDSVWWYAEHPYKPHMWYACNREFMALQSGESSTHPAPGKKIDYLFSCLLFETKGAFDTRINLIKDGVAGRDDAWLRDFIRTFGHTNTRLIAMMPEQVQWDEVHQVLHHYPAWLAANEAGSEFPQDLALRMCGLGQVLDQVEAKSLLEATW